MSVRKIKGSWRYRIVIKLPDGKKQRISGTPEINTRAAAEREERLHIERVKIPSTGPRVPLSEPIDVFARRWLEEHTIAAGNRTSTRTQRESHLRTRILPFFDGQHIGTITGAQISGFRSKLLAELAPTSAASVMTTLTLLLRGALDAGQIAQLPRMPAPIKVPEGKKIGFTDAEQAALLTACETDEERLELIFALDTGARASEQLGVLWEDVDFAKRRIWIRRQRYMGETRETKTGVERYVDLTQRLGDHLDRLHADELKKYGVNNLGMVPGAPTATIDGFVFHDGHWRPRTYSHLASLLEKLRRRAKAAGIEIAGSVEIKGSWHKLRHTFASRCINKDIPPHVIQRWLGHTSLEHTMDYAHLDDGTGERFIKALD